MDFGVRTRTERLSAGGSSEGLAALSACLARRLADEHANSNLVFSPLSVYTALALLATGARGATLDEILRVLGARSRGELDEFVARTAGDALRDQSRSGDPRVAFACGVWSDQSCPLKPGFREAIAAGAYGAEASTVNFHGDPNGACRLINAWAARATKGLVDSVLAEVSVTRDARVVLGSALYFKGKWEHPFDKRSTQGGLFRRLCGAGAVNVSYMQSCKRHFVAVHDGFKVHKLQYKTAEARRSHAGKSNNRLGDPKRLTPYSRSSDGQNRRGSDANTQGSFSTRTGFSMCIFLPDADDGLPSLLDAIASCPGFLHKHLPHKEVKVGEFKLPRFKLSFHSSVVNALDKLGLRLPFHEAANLSDMAEDDHSGFPLVVSDVIHKAVIEVNEEGTKAAAATIVSNAPKKMPLPPVDFVADYPFAFFIVEEETKAVVFAGHVLDPSRL
ncbi:hypothetical protein ACQ4PT_028035 [Festuca glaucescens]